MRYMKLYEHMRLDKYTVTSTKKKPEAQWEERIPHDYGDFHGLSCWATNPWYHNGLKGKGWKSLSRPDITRASMATSARHTYIYVSGMLRSLYIPADPPGVEQCWHSVPPCHTFITHISRPSWRIHDCDAYSQHNCIARRRQEPNKKSITFCLNSSLTKKCLLEFTKW